MKPAVKLLVAALVLAVPLAACEGAPTAPNAPADAPRPQYGANGNGAQLVACTSHTGAEAEFLVTREGGTLELGKSRIDVPPDAVAEATTIRFALLAGAHLVADLTANGLPTFQFQRELAVTLDYSRCGSLPASTRLTVWYIDLETGALLKDMNGTADRGKRTITFRTDHFSGYALAE
jgi:hypothetical protein